MNVYVLILKIRLINECYEVCLSSTLCDAKKANFNNLVSAVQMK